MCGCAWTPTVVLSGTARGADLCGEAWAAAHGLPVERYPATWRVDGKFDRAAGHRRNTLMAEHAEALVALWNGESPGTRNMIDTARRLGLRVHLWKPESAR